jgi:cell fate regulator YaaT (PSP1 superfamily)
MDVDENMLANCKPKTKAQERQLDILKLERQLDKLRTLVEDKQQMAIQGQVLFYETNTNCQILYLK